MIDPHKLALCRHFAVSRKPREFHLMDGEGKVIAKEPNHAYDPLPDAVYALLAEREEMQRSLDLQREMGDAARRDLGLQLARAETAERDLAAALAVLREVEWNGFSGISCDAGRCCPVCDAPAWDEDGRTHEPGCRLAALLGKEGP